MQKNLSDIVLSLQIGLLSSVSSSLRAITINLDAAERELKISFFYDEEVDDQLFDLASISMDEITLPLEYIIKDKIIMLKYPEKIPDEEILVYYRKEDKILANIKKANKYLTCPYSEKEYFSARLRFIMQKVLLGAITSNIREIGLNWSEDIIYVHFYYQGEGSEKDKKNMHEIMQKLFMHFPNFYIHLRYYRMDEPIVLPEHQERVFFRYEKEYGQKPLFSPKKR